MLPEPPTNKPLARPQGATPVRRHMVPTNQAQYPGISINEDCHIAAAVVWGNWHGTMEFKHFKHDDTEELLATIHGSGGPVQFAGPFVLSEPGYVSLSLIDNQDFWGVPEAEVWGYDTSNVVPDSLPLQGGS